MLGKLTKSKVASDTVMTGSMGKLGMNKHGTNTNEQNIPFESSTLGITDPTTDADDTEVGD